MKVKVCGITNVADAMLCERLGADYIGLNFYAGSSRCITLATAKKIMDSLRTTKGIGIFVEHKIEDIKMFSEKLGLHAIQIYEDVNIQAFNGKVIRVLRFPLSKPVMVESEADYYLYDTYHPRELGGSGISFDWSLLPLDRTRIFLAGGIGVHNIHAAKLLKPYAIDLCSSVESSPGKKCPQKLSHFFEEFNRDK